MSDALPVGTLLLDPGDGRPKVWTVVSPRQVIGAAENLCMRATLTKTPTADSLPEGWQIIDNRQLAAHLSRLYEARVLVSSQCGHRQEGPTAMEIEHGPETIVRKCEKCGAELFWQQNEWRKL